jgi:hypothetical protein
MHEILKIPLYLILVNFVVPRAVFAKETFSKNINGLDA